MLIKEFFDIEAGFRNEEEIKFHIKESVSYEGENPSTAKIFKFFSTSKQRTYLVATNKRLYCILDDKRKNTPHLNWSMKKSEIKKDNELRINITTLDKTDKIGLVNIGEKHKRWLYSKNLFKTKGIEASIKDFLIESM